MFDSLEDLSVKLTATGYFVDPVMTQVVFLAAKLRKPLLLKGPAGSGKTEPAPRSWPPRGHKSLRQCLCLPLEPCWSVDVTVD